MCNCNENNFYPTTYESRGTGNYAIIIVLFILLVIILGTRCSN